MNSKESLIKYLKENKTFEEELSSSAFGECVFIEVVKCDDKGSLFTIEATISKNYKIIYRVCVSDFKNMRHYNWVSPGLKEDFNKEQADMGFDPKIGWIEDDDIIETTDLEVFEDFIEKSNAIISNSDYDTRLLVNMNIDKELVYDLMLIAHSKDITLNELINEIMLAKIENKLI